ncbi:hypothetical protein AX15_002330 [Amanita polypyramis BW_CC]|nr:hypothetical protein AX15_002330 [Amanita polypyramis BW_CC]
MLPFDPSIPLKYLGLPQDYIPHPEADPIAFLTNHLAHLPPHILQQFSSITGAKQRTIIPTIRNRRLKYTSTKPVELDFRTARKKWPQMWRGRERIGLDKGKEEKEWANHEFLAGQQQYVGKLGNLLGEYEEEREAERTRVLHRQVHIPTEFVPEEDDSESESESDEIPAVPEEESEEEAIRSFERLVRERFIYGLLEDVDYDRVDWDESLDTEDNREAEERWFDEEEEDM